MKGKIFKTILPVAIIAVGVSSFLYLKSTKPQAKPRPVEERVWTVAVSHVERKDIQPEISAYGEVRAASVAELRPQVIGRIVEISPMLVNGAVVAKGEVLLKIDPFDYQIAVSERQADVSEIAAKTEEIRADLTAEKKLIVVLQQQKQLREQELARQKNLKTRGTASEKSRDEAMIAVNAAEQALITSGQHIKQFNARLKQQRAAADRANVQLQRAQRNLQDTELQAPFDGFLADVNAAVGQRVQPSDRVARLVDASRLEVVFQLNNSDYASLLTDSEGQVAGLVGRPVSVNWHVGDNLFEYQARIERVSAEIDAASGGVDIHASISRTDVSLPLRPGAFVQVSLLDRVYQQSILLPDSAVINRDTVYLVNKESRLQSAGVKVLRRVGRDLLLTADLPMGARVVTNSFPEISSGLKVEIKGRK